MPFSPKLFFLLVAGAASAQDPGSPKLNIVVVEGEGAINNIRQRTAREPIVQVEDQNHKPVAGAAVVFMLPSNGPSGVFANGSRTLTAMTDNQGRAVARGLRPTGKGQMQIRVSASHQGQTASATITQTNAIVAAGVAGAAAGGLSAKLIAIIAVAAGAATAGAVVAATRGGGNTPGTPASSSTTVTPGTGTVGPPR